MLRLVMNENLKIFAKKSSWIMLIILVGITLFSGIYQYQTLPAPQDDWRAPYELQIRSAEEALKSPILPEYQKKELVKTIKVNHYILENDIVPKVSVWEQVQKNSALISLITMFTAAVAGGIVAGEFNKGTIKLLLIRPISRSKVLLSKYLAVMSFGMLALTILVVVSFLFNGVLFGFEGSAKPFLYVGHNGEVMESNMMVKAIQTYALKSLEIIMFSTIAFMLSVLSRSTTMAVGVSLVSIILGPQMTSAFSKYAWAKYLVFAHTDPSLLFTGNPFGISVFFSMIVFAAYFILFNLISWVTFKQRDVSI